MRARRGVNVPETSTKTRTLAVHLREARVATLLGRPVESALDALDPELAELVQRTADTFARSIGDETRKTYARRWDLFEQWCTRQHLQALPAASPETVMLYLAETAGEGVALGTLRGWMAALNRVHLEAGESPPGDDPGMSIYLRGLSRLAGRRRCENVSALRIALLRQVCEVLDPTGVPAHERARPSGPCAASGQAERRRGLPDFSGLIFVLASRRPPCVSGQPGSGGRIGVSSCERERTSATALCALSNNGGPLPRTTSRGSSRPSTRTGHRASRPLARKSIYLIRKSRLSSLSRTHDLDATISELGHPSSEALRDRAIILLGFAGAFRRVDLVRLEWRDIDITPQGAIVHLRRSKTDPEGRGCDVGIPLGRSPLTCPVAALTGWRNVYEVARTVTPDAPVFVRVGRSGRLGEDPLTGEAITDIVKRRARQAELRGSVGRAEPSRRVHIHSSGPRHPPRTSRPSEPPRHAGHLDSLHPHRRPIPPEPRPQCRPLAEDTRTSPQQRWRRPAHTATEVRRASFRSTMTISATPGPLPIQPTQFSCTSHTCRPPRPSTANGFALNCSASTPPRDSEGALHGAANADIRRYMRGAYATLPLEDAELSEPLYKEHVPILVGATAAPTLTQLRDVAVALTAHATRLPAAVLTRLQWHQVQFTRKSVALSVSMRVTSGPMKRTKIEIAARPDSLCVVKALQRLRRNIGYTNPYVFASPFGSSDLSRIKTVVRLVRGIPNKRRTPERTPGDSSGQNPRPGTPANA